MKDTIKGNIYKIFTDNKNKEFNCKDLVSEYTIQQIRQVCLLLYKKGKLNKKDGGLYSYKPPVTDGILILERSTSFPYKGEIWNIKRISQTKVMFTMCGRNRVKCFEATKLDGKNFTSFGYSSVETNIGYSEMSEVLHAFIKKYII